MFYGGIICYHYEMICLASCKTLESKSDAIKTSKYLKDYMMKIKKSRRDFLKYMSILGVTAFYSTPLYAKTTKMIVKYKLTPNKNGDKCAMCMHFIPKTKECKIVEGAIVPNGWCINFFKNPSTIKKV